MAGTAVYTDDIPPVAGELHCGLVLSTRAHAAILSLDPAAALLLPGVVAWLDRNSVRPGGNTFATAITQDELVFAEDTVHCQGQVVGAVVAEDRDTAQRAARRGRTSGRARRCSAPSEGSWRNTGEPRACTPMQWHFPGTRCSIRQLHVLRDRW